MRVRTTVLCGLMLFGCTAAPEEEAPAGADGKADGSSRLLKCTQVPDSPNADSASIEGPLYIYDQGLATTVPDDLPSGVYDWIISEGFAVKKYRFVTKLSIDGGDATTIDRTYYGNLFVGDGNDYQHGHAYARAAAYELSVPDAGEDKPFRLHTKISVSTAVAIPLTCEGTLPTEAEALGDDPNGLALDFACDAAATATQPSESFTFTAIRLDRPDAIQLVDRNGDGLPVAAADDSELLLLDDNYTISATGTQLVLEGDGDGIEFAELKLTRPAEAGARVTGTFKRTESDGTVLSTRSVSCTTSAATL